MMIDTALTMLSVKDADPFGFYETLRARGPIVRDEMMNAWLVLDYAECRHIESNEAAFANPYAGSSAPQRPSGVQRRTAHLRRRGIGAD